MKLTAAIKCLHNLQGYFSGFHLLLFFLNAERETIFALFQKVLTLKCFIQIMQQIRFH